MIQSQDILSNFLRSDLSEFLRKGGFPLFAFDFDGTLAEIVDDPSSAMIAPRVFESLQRLGTKVPVVIITGRSVEDVRSRLPKTIITIVGSHGFEGHSLVSQNDLDIAFTSTRLWIEILLKITSKFGKTNRVWIEDKKYSLCVHYRDKKTAPLLPKLIAQIRGLVPEARLVLGKRVVNLVPKGMPNKLDALRNLMHVLRRDRAFFIGDDVTDEVVFSDKSPEIFSVKVGFDSDLSAAYFLHKQDDIEVLLEFFHSVLSTS